MATTGTGGKTLKPSGATRQSPRGPWAEKHSTAKLEGPERYREAGAAEAPNILGASGEWEKRLQGHTA